MGSKIWFPFKTDQSAEVQTVIKVNLTSKILRKCSYNCLDNTKGQNIFLKKSVKCNILRKNVCGLPRSHARIVAPMVFDGEVVKVKEQRLFGEISSLTFEIKDMVSVLTVCWIYQKHLIVVQVRPSHSSQYIENKIKDGTDQSEIYAMRPHRDSVTPR